MTFKEIQEVMESKGWTFECISPLEIRHDDGSFASLNAAQALMETFNKSTDLTEDVRCLRCLSEMVRHEGDGREYVAYECHNCAEMEVQISSERDEARKQIDKLRTDMFNVTESAARYMCRSPRDWSLDHRDAWLWMIFCGWEGEALNEVICKHNWGEDGVNRLKELRETVKSLG